MFIKLLLVFLCIPAIELFFLLEIHSLIGTAPTIALILSTGMAGAYLTRIQGLQVLGRIASELEAGCLPGNELLDGAMVLVGGVLLLTPGFCTDLLGFFLLVPGTRTLAKRLIAPLLQRLSERGAIRFYRR